jgi:hypothetical protein
MAPNPRRKRNLRRPTTQLAEIETDRANQRSAQTPAPGISRNLEHKWFESDRSAVLRQIDLVQGAIDRNAQELGMVAVEGVFEKPLSDGLSRASRALHAIARELGSLRVLITRSSRYPKAKRKRS